MGMLHLHVGVSEREGLRCWVGRGKWRVATVRRVDLDAPKGFRRAIEYSVNRTVSKLIIGKLHINIQYG